jgi:tellurite resistance protein TerA
MAIQLEKGKPISFSKDAAVAEIILTWTSDSDPDIGAMCKTVGQAPYVVQALGHTFGCLGKPPFAVLDKDDRHGGQETLRINLARADQIERILVYGTIYRGGNWNNVGDARVTVRHPRHEEYIIDLSKSSARSVGLVDFRSQNGSLVMTRLEDFINGTEPDIDRFYSFPGISWKSGRK